MNIRYKKQLISRCGGFSLVELMIAMALGLFITAAVLQTFISMKKTYTFTEEFSRIQENGRFAIEFLSRDIRNAAFWGCNSNGLGSGTIVEHLQDGGAEAFAFDADIDGTDGAPDAGGNSALDAPDTLFLRTANDSGIEVLQHPSPNGADIKVTRNSGLQEGDIILVSDCSRGDIFQITNDPTTGNAGFDNLVHNGNTNGVTPGNDGPSDADYTALPNPSYGPPDAVVYRASAIQYEITAGASGLPSLYRNGDEIVEGVENMQILYGVDDNDDKVPDYYAPATAIDMDKVVSIEVSLLLVSIGDSLTNAPANIDYNGSTYNSTDRKLRKVFSSRVAIRNRLN